MDNRITIIEQKALIFVFGFLFVGIAFVVGLNMGYNRGQDLARNAAVKAGAARWVADPKTGEATFEYRSVGTVGARP